MSQDEKVKLRLLHHVFDFALINSTDPSTKNGAYIIANDYSVLAYGVNEFPRKVKETPERWQRPLKYSYVEHAERNAIYDAARIGLRVANKTMICTWFACPDCARAIVQAGIQEVVGLDIVGCPEQWNEPVRIGREILAEAGVKMTLIKGPIGVKMLLNGVLTDQ